LAWPATVPFAALRDHVRAHTPGAGEAELDTIVYVHLVTLLNMSALQYRLEPAPYQENLPAKPAIIPGLAVLFAAQIRQLGGYNLWHQTLNSPTDEIIKFVMNLLDGTHTHAQLRSHLRTALALGKLQHPNGKSMKNVRNLDAIAQDLLNQVFANLNKMGVLL